MIWLSIITPVFNAVRYVKCCLESVCSQDFNGVEHIICDGGSTDGTLEILQEYARKYPHIRLISEPDCGQSNAVNKGIALANGNWMGLLNADDYYAPGVFAQLKSEIAHLRGPSIVIANCQEWKSDSEVLGLNIPRARNFRQIMAGWEFPYNPSAYFYPIRLHSRVGLYDETDHYTADLDFLIRAYRAAPVHYVNAIWGNYRRIPGAKTFDEEAAGRMYARCDATRAKYAHLLTAYDRIWILSARWALRVKRAAQRYAAQAVK